MSPEQVLAALVADVGQMRRRIDDIREEKRNRARRVAYRYTIRVR